MAAVRTIFLMAEECGRGERLGWSEFVRDYYAVARALLLQFFPMLEPELESHIAGLFQRARANDNAWFKGLKFANEREFLMPFRELVFAYGREMARVPTPELSLDQMREIMKDLTVVERELLWLCVKGYSAGQIAPMMMNAGATAQAVKGVADQRLLQVLPGATEDAFNISCRSLTEAAEKAGGEQCLPLRTFNNLINGQLSWRERDVAEEHIRDCFYCIDRFTSFQEMIRLRKDAEPLPPDRCEPILATLNLPAGKPKGVLARLLGK